MYKTCMESCDTNETFDTTVEVTPAGGAVVNLFISDGELSVGYGRHNDSPDTDFTGTHYSAAFYDCPRVYGYEPTCAASYSSSTDVVKANVLPGTHAFTANNVLYARLDITYYATGTDTSSLFVWGGSGVYSCGAWGAWCGGVLSTHIMFMDVTCNNGGSIRVEFDPYLNAGGRYVLEYALELNYYDSQTSNARMYKTCMGSCGANEALGETVEVPLPRSLSTTGRSPWGMTVTTAHLILILPVLSIQRRFTIVLPPHATSTSTWHLTCARRASEVRQTQRGTIRAGRTLLAAARRILPSFITCARRAATGVPPMRAMRFQVRTLSVFILPVSKLSEYTSWRTTWRTTRTGRGTTELKRYRSPRPAWKTAIFALATRLASRQPW